MGAPPFQQHGTGYTTDDPASSFGPSLTLGGYGETPLQMATGAAVLAAAGVSHEPEAILSWQLRRGTSSCKEPSTDWGGVTRGSRHQAALI